MGTARERQPRRTWIRPIPVKPPPCPVRTMATGPVVQEFHRQRQGHRRPATSTDRHSSGGAAKTIKSQGDGDPPQERRPDRPLGATADTVLLLRQTRRGQQQQPVRRQRPQRRTHPVGPTLQNERPLMDV
ncbi:hypothetical protein GCM10011578_086150 [Streptomyces fuscichromogenes]|uniref:Uncharacterized protein n=1 Tax=Streptomyces fuscichromogenes TaxID=1324013 RepID=A0A917XM26_9ACTN|nr:hypothetical protein GCM10011578_086150 [Streptomyces fuscichromogenes]